MEIHEVQVGAAARVMARVADGGPADAIERAVGIGCGAVAGGELSRALHEAGLALARTVRAFDGSCATWAQDAQSAVRTFGRVDADTGAALGLRTGAPA